VCYNNSNKCDDYGKLYTWAEAISVCPHGWHLPSEAEWNALVAAAGGSSVAGFKLKAEYGWDSGDGMDEFDFAALPGGNYDNSSFANVINLSYWWGATEVVANTAYRRTVFYYNDVVRRDSYDKSVALYSVRCVKN
jgi:uncharacterized protein (TIGR02145 family)